MDTVLTRAGFTAWLATKEGMEIVGRTGNAATCPVARYLRSLGHDEAMVREDYYILDGDREWSVMEPAERFPLEDWALRLVRTVDGDLLRDHIDAATLRGMLSGIA